VFEGEARRGDQIIFSMKIRLSVRIPEGSGPILD
jgi:hypothetical protein